MSQTLSSASMLEADLLQQLTTAVMWLDADGVIRLVNHRVCETLGVGRRYLLNRSLVEVAPVVADYLPEDMTGGLAIDRCEFTRADGGKLTLRVVFTPLNTQLGDGWMVEWVLQDRALHIQNEMARWEEGHINQLLVQTLAHEIKNPLAGLKGAAQLLNRQLKQWHAEDSEAFESYLQVIMHESDRLAQLVDRMLGPRQSPSFALHSVGELLQRVLVLLEPVWQAQEGIDLKLDLDTSIPEFYFDFDLMVQAVLNVMTNGVQALQSLSPLAKKTLTVSTRVKHHFTIGDQLHPLVVALSIEDNGPGIPEHLHSQIFLPLISNKAAGSGLGLSVTQQLLRKHDGLVLMNSEAGHTVFTLYLPLRRHLKRYEGV